MFPLCTLRSGAAIKFRDRLGRTAFNVAIESGNEACAHSLYQVGSYSHKSETLLNYIYLTKNIYRMVMMLRTVNENAAGLRTICKRSDQPKNRKTRKQ